MQWNLANDFTALTIIIDNYQLRNYFTIFAGQHTATQDEAIIYVLFRYAAVVDFQS